MRSVPLWTVPLAAILGVVAGLLLCPYTSPRRPALPDVDAGAASVFIVGTDPNLDAGATYLAEHAQQPPEGKLWRYRRYTFTFRQETATSRAHAAVIAALHAEMRRAVRED